MKMCNLNYKTQYCGQIKIFNYKNWDESLKRVEYSSERVKVYTAKE